MAENQEAPTKSVSRLKQEVIDWQRQSLYHKQHAAALQQEIEILRKMLVKHKVDPHKLPQPASPAKALHVFDEAAYLNERSTLLEKISELTEEVQVERLRAAGLDLRLKETLAENNQLCHREGSVARRYEEQLAEARDEIKRLDSMMRTHASTRELRIRQDLVAQAESKLHAHYAQEIAQIKQQARDAATAFQDTLEEELRKVHKHRQAELRLLMEQHSRTLERLEREHQDGGFSFAAPIRVTCFACKLTSSVLFPFSSLSKEMERITEVWRRKLGVVERSNKVLANPEQLTAAVTMQTKLLELAARRSAAATPHS
ncbi:uncharacterized protein MONBRDRAFT_25092 [Monosiga brevicollis MX1]|uniref:Uncharacterized protein n=1 Tax=Monosiga brevicollis TaxID=81824 RepID=A9UYE0_MONBE|nr:uncharacterized protein MONBRDRAFT_25092 [Monosiga brevicollis MX1]EDQ89446.1 predicted protein [Monosiga brevicollis MX1]|eukprot:XP_001745475.1 hypothetical protein [Monosiga brevicollis MX1]